MIFFKARTKVRAFFALFTECASVLAVPQPCLRRLTFFCLARKKSAKKRRFRTRGLLPHATLATNQTCQPLQANELFQKELRLPCPPEQHAKFANRCLRSSANNAHSSKAKNPVPFSPKLPYPKNQLPAKNGQQRSALPRSDHETALARAFGAIARQYSRPL